jgi:hypothetical protein
LFASDCAFRLTFARSVAEQSLFTNGFEA